MRTRRRLRLLVLAAAGGASLLGGCISSQHHVTHTARSATEQLLVTTAAERALTGLDWPELAARGVAVEVAAPGGTESAWLQAAAEVWARDRGARVVGRDEAEQVLLVVAGAIGTEGRDVSVGVPAIPTPFGVSPPLPLFGRNRRLGYARLQLQPLEPSGAGESRGAPAEGRAVHTIYRLLFLRFETGSIPDVQE